MRQNRRRGSDVSDKFFSRANNFNARLEIPVLTGRHQTSPAPRNEGARTGAGDARGGVHTARPGWIDVVLVTPELLRPVEDGAVPLGREPVLVRVARDGRHALESKVEWLGFEPRSGEERHQKTAEAAVDVQGNRLFDCQFGQGGDVVDDAVWEVGG